MCVRMYVCVYACMYVCTHVCMCVRMFVCVYACMYVCCECMQVETTTVILERGRVQVYIHIQAHVRCRLAKDASRFSCLHLRIHACVDACMHVRMSTCVCVSSLEMALISHAVVVLLEGIGPLSTFSLLL